MATTMIPPAAARPFLDRSGWENAEILPLAGDASFRRYFRVRDGDRQAVLMDAPPPHEDPRPFIAIASYLTENGFGAPEILAHDLNAGLVLLEDFGDRRMRDHLDETPQDEEDVYARAVALLARLHDVPSADVPPYDTSVYHREVNLLTEWYCPAVGLEIDETGYRESWDAVLHLADWTGQGVTVLRDYHAENIMLLPADQCAFGLGLLDFQDALTGHRAYDLVSLLQDARRDVSPELEAAMLCEYRALTGEGEAFDTAYAVLGAQRNAKIIGIFTRLWQRDGKPRYLSLLPRMWGLLERDLAHPALLPVRTWFDANIPMAVRQRALTVD